jgi:subtilisin family serine protease
MTLHCLHPLQVQGCRSIAASSLRYSLLLLLLLSLSPLFAVPEYTPGQILFKTTEDTTLRSDKTGLTAFDSYLNQHGVKKVTAISGMPAPRYFRAELNMMPDLQQMKSLSFAGIEYIEPNYLRKLHTTPNDPLYPRQQHHVCSIPQAWDYSTGSEQIIVAVVDSGLLIDHPDIADNVYINHGEIPDNGIDDDGNGYIDDWCGWDFVDAPEMADVALGDYLEQDSDVTDENFHGTHVAGIIGAKGNNSIGVSGVCWNVRIMPLRAGFRTSDAGYLQDDDAAAAIIYAADNGAHVINMSWGDPNYSAIIADACDYAHAKGVVLVASSGNDPGPVLSYPARLSNVISVGSVNAAKVLSGFSSYGHDLDLVAPGEFVISTYKDSGDDMYMEMSGTSMSSPYVVGSVALLLSLVPGLSPDEVRARLLNATEDINSPGFDIYTGHGLLNTKKLLDNLHPPFVQIDYPLDQSGICGSTEIRGSVYGEDFARYSLMYRSISDSTMSDWKDAREHTSQPHYFSAEVINDVLGEFYVPASFQEGTYMLRLQYEKRYNNMQKYNYFLTVTVDRSIPELRPEKLMAFSRYDKENLRHYITATFDEQVRTELKIWDSNGQEHSLYGTLADSLQIWALPQYLPEGMIDISIKASNHSNLSFESEVFTDFMDIYYESIPTHGYYQRAIGRARVALNRWHDFNGNGQQEYVAMDVPVTGYGDVYAYEVYEGGHIQTHAFDDNFWPLDLGDTNSSGMELLLIKSESAILWDTPTGAQYPSADSLVFSDTGITGGIIADHNGNGNRDLLLIKNLPASRVIQLYSRNNLGVLSPGVTLHNTTETDLRNNFVPTILVDNFDQDSRPEIVTADTDGDIIIFEVPNSAEATMVWHHRLPVGNSYQLASGDFNGDGQKDFIVGGSYTDIMNNNLNFWHFEAFTWSPEDTTYVSMGVIQFNKVESQNAITVMDMDNDGQDEVILGISPNLYIVKHIDGEFKPIFKGDSYANYRLATWRDADDRAWVMSNYRVSPDSLIAVEWTLDEPYTGPPAPNNVMIQALGSDSIQISWIDHGADHYRIYRKTEEDDMILIDNVSGDTYLDTGLEEGQRYYYAVSSVHAAFDPAESLLSGWQDTIPLPVPEIIELSMVGDRELRAHFNQQMPSDILNPVLYSLSHGLGNPMSVNSTAQQTGIQLRFRESFPAIDSLFTLQLNNVRGDSGILAGTDIYHFPYIQDLEAPTVQEVKILPKNRSVEIVFSEDIEELPAQYLGNYTLHCPENDTQNRIVDITADQDRVTISFEHALKFSNEAYFIQVHNVTDLSGNVISPLHNLARFALRDITDLSDIVVFPNPMRHPENSELVFMNFPPHHSGKIAIYEASGALVYKSSIGPFNPDNNRITWRWNATNQDGKKVSSGIFFYIIEMDGERARGKFAIIN